MPRKQTSIKVDPIAWEAAKKIFSEYGITASEAINIFL
ncbi:MAG: type II toxin-antitoxin system antitoxin, RelB/DinJ family, partial [Epsilonproteobacteria bacterium]|nr:type II toxin-antitoxin system antitoxin, RelB/DinJ family [Campylobacterota bacterium]